MSSIVDRRSGGQPQSCRNCAYRRTGHDDWYECHRHAPQLSVERECDDRAIKPVSRWPNVSLSDWCGDYNALGTKKSEVGQ